jgi:RNA polymerase sigma-70 factor (ECF subfamily)
MDLDVSSLSDGEIVHRVLQGDVNAFEILLNRYKAYTLRIVNRHVPSDEIEDISQEVFIRAYRSLPSFKGESGFKQWLAAITVRACYDFWRKRYRTREHSMSSLAETQRNWLEKIMMDRSQEVFGQQQAGEVLNWALSRLPAEDKMIVELVYLQGLSGKEAAELLGWSVAKVKVRSFRARKKLQKLFESVTE